VNSLPMTVTWQCRGCDLNPGPSVPDSTLTTLLPSHPLDVTFESQDASASISAGAPPQTPPGAFTALPNLTAAYNGTCLEGKVKERA